MIVPDKSMKTLLEEATQNYHDQLSGSEAEHYLVKERKLSKEVLDSFRIGFIQTVHRPEHNQYKGCIVFPYITHTGVVGLRFRRPGKGNNVITPAGDIARLYNVKALVDDLVYLTEGEIDCITAVQCGLPAVAAPGANSFQRQWAPAFRYRRVVVLTDGDEAGKKFYDKVSTHLNSSVKIEMPEGSDVNQYYLDYGSKGLRKWVGVDV